MKAARLVMERRRRRLTTTGVDHRCFLENLQYSRCVIAAYARGSSGGLLSDCGNQGSKFEVGVGDAARQVVEADQVSENIFWPLKALDKSSSSKIKSKPNVTSNKS